MTKPLPVAAIVEAARRTERREFRKLVREVRATWIARRDGDDPAWPSTYEPRIGSRFYCAGCGAPKATQEESDGLTHPVLCYDEFGGDHGSETDNVYNAEGAARAVQALDEVLAGLARAGRKGRKR